MNTEFHRRRMSFKVIFSVSVSVLSLALSQFSNSLFLANELSLSSSISFINQLLFRFSSNPNYVFLFCNGILVLIITNSAHFPGSLQPEKSAGNDSLQLRPGGNFVQEGEEEDERAGDDERAISGAHPHQHHLREEEEEDMEMVVFRGGDHHDKEEEEDDDDEEGEEDGRSDGLSDEEWDKKFNEFTKKMKQDFII